MTEVVDGDAAVDAQGRAHSYPKKRTDALRTLPTAVLGHGYSHKKARYRVSLKWRFVSGRGPFVPR